MSGHDGAYVWIAPGRQSGTPCVGGTRVEVDYVAEAVWRASIEDVMGDYDLTRGAVLAACWYAGTYGIVRVYGKGGVRPYRSPWRARWSDWAAEHHHAMWQAKWDDVPDPPTKEAP